VAGDHRWRVEQRLEQVEGEPACVIVFLGTIGSPQVMRPNSTRRFAASTAASRWAFLGRDRSGIVRVSRHDRHVVCDS